MNSRKAAQAIALQVKECGCSHCSYLVMQALGSIEGYEKFFKEYAWSGK